MEYYKLKSKCKREYDYIVTLLITNEISLLLTWMLAKSKVTPNQISITSIISGFICCLCYSAGWFTAGSIFLFISHILDCTDGNLARAKELFSSFGRWLDFISDRLSEIFVFLGVSFYYYNTSETLLWIILPLIDSVFLLFYYYIVDVSLSLGISEKKQKITSLKLKGVYIKWGLFEPVIYGFIVLAPLGLLKFQIICVLFITILGLIYQGIKNYKHLIE